MKNRVYDNGIYRNMTQAEIQSAANVPVPEHEITPEERIEALETAFMEFVEVVLNG